MIKRTFPLISLFAMVAAASAHSPELLGKALKSEATFTSPNVAVVEPGRLYIKVKPGQDANVARSLESINGKVESSFPQIGWKSVTFPTSLSVASAQSKLAKYSSLSKVEPSYRRFYMDVPNDPMVSQQYTLPVMRLPEAWSIGKGNPGITIAVIDSGFDIGHPDFAGVLLPGMNLGDGAVDDLTDTVGHGTHVAGSVGAATNNGIGIAGNAWGSKILPLKVATAAGGVSGDGLIKAIIAAGDMGANIANISIGGFGFSTAEEEAINYSNGKGVLFISSAGNSNTSTKSYPAAFEVCVAVAATDRFDVRADFSNFGRDWVDVAAPGVDILSLWPRARIASGYNTISGTSMASPNTAGVAGLIASQFLSSGVKPTNTQIRAILESTTDFVGDYVKFGRINAFSALGSIGTPVTSTPVPSAPVVKEGTVTAGSAVSDVISAKNNVSATLRPTKKPGVGLSGSFSTAFTLTGISTGELRRATMNLTLSGDTYTTFQVYFFDNSLGQWTLFKAQTNSKAMKSTSYNLPLSTLSRYMDGNRLPVLFRSLVPVSMSNRASGVTKIDQASVTFTGIKRPVAGNNP